MSKVAWLVLCTCLFVGGSNHNARAWFWNDSSLATINGETFSTQDYQNWWENWQEENMDVPASPEEFINWQLMAQEGERMQLDREMDYQRKVATFLKVRALMIFKNEEVDSKVKISQDELWAIYAKEYSPRWQIGVFFFETEEVAAQQGDALRRGTLSGEELKNLSVKEGGPLFTEAKWLRRPQIKEEWLTVLTGKKAGHITPPQPMGKYFIILNFMEEKGPTEEDFATLKTSIARKISKQRSGELTVQLVEQLKRKYQVVVDQEFLATIEDTPLDLERSEQPVITTNQENISAGALQAMIAKERQFRKQYKFQPEDSAALKERVVASMLGQTLISWEAIDRHYENKQPFKTTYDFYRKHRLTKEIEKRFIRPNAELEDGEVLAFYEKNQHLYSSPEVISFAVVEGEPELINRMRQEMVQGEDFFAVTSKHFPNGLPIQQVPLNHIEEGLKTPLLALSKGEVSAPFTFNKNSAMVKLVNRRSAVPVPFKQVKDELTKKLGDEKFTTSRKDFLTILKKKSAITVNQKTWTKLYNELLQQNESKETK
jgi:hypothetical protein